MDRNVEILAEGGGDTQHNSVCGQTWSYLTNPLSLISLTCTSLPEMEVRARRAHPVSCRLVTVSLLLPAGFVQKGCRLELLLHFLHCYYICIALNAPISCRERTLMSSENPKETIPVCFQRQNSFQTSGTDKKIAGTQICNFTFSCF